MKRYVFRYEADRSPGQWFERISTDLDASGDAVYKRHFPDGTFWYLVLDPGEMTLLADVGFFILTPRGRSEDPYQTLQLATHASITGDIAILEAEIDDDGRMTRLIATHPIAP